jgi:outer membrane biosynthesis protein TonB
MRMGVLLFSIAGHLLAQNAPVLDESIKPLHFEPLSYPLAAKLTHVQGAVVVRVRLDREGNVVSSTPVSGAKSLIPECLSNSKKWRFQPAPEGTAIIVYLFRIEGLCKQPCTSLFRFDPPNLATITTGNPVVE